MAAKQSSMDVVKNVISAVKEMDLAGLAKEVAYSILFSLAPLLIALTALSGIVTRAVNGKNNPAGPVLEWMSANLPSDAANFLDTPIQNAMSTGGGFMLSFGGLLALWGAKGAMSAIMKGLNTAYGVEKDSRGFVEQTLVALGLTVALAAMLGLGAFVFTLGTGVGDTLAGGLGLGSVWSTISTWLRWPLLAVIVIIAVAIIHNFAPNIDADLKWFFPGAVFTVVGWVVASLLLTLYFNFSGGYSKAYGTFGSVLAFLFWLWVMSMVILVGGVVNRAVQQEVPPARNSVKREDDASNDNEDLLANKKPAMTKQ